MDLIMVKRFNPVDFYDKKKNMPTVLRGAPTTKVDRVKLDMSPTTALGGVARVAGTIAEQIRAANEKKVSEERRKMRSALLRAYMAPKKVFDPSTFDASEVQASILEDELPEELDEQIMRIPDAEAAALESEKELFGRENPSGMEAALRAQSQYVPAESGYFGPGAGAYAGMGDETIDELSLLEYNNRLAKEERERVAEVKKQDRINEREDYKYQQKYKAFAPQVEKRTKEYKNAIAMGLTPGTLEFNAYMQKASRLVPEPVNEMWTSNAKSLSKTLDEWRSKGQEAPVFISKLGDLRKVLSTGVDQGYGQNFLNAAAGIAKRTGIAIDMENLTGAQVAGSLINQLVVPRVKDLGAKPTDKDLQFIIDIFPKITNQKGSNDLILQVLELDSKRNIARSDFAASWLKTNAKNDPYGLKFNDDLKEFYKGNDIFKEFVPPAWVLDKKGGAGGIKAGAGGTIVKITSDADYDKVKPGQEFIDPNGNRRRKPNG
jgi:hypothetical protein